MSEEQTQLEKQVAQAIMGILQEHDPNWHWSHRVADEVAQRAVREMERHLATRLLGDIVISVGLDK